MDNSLITVGLTAWREGDLLQEAIQSLLDQTEPNWRCNLVLDGGADQETLAIVESVTDPRIRTFILPENVGPYPAMNLAIRRCETEYFYILGGDDVLPPNAVALAEAAYQDPSVDYFCGRVKLVQPNGEVSYPGGFLPDATKLVGGQFPGLVSFRRRLWQEVGGYAQELSRGKGDMDFVFSVIEGGYKGRASDEVVYIYRKRPKSVSSSYVADVGTRHEIIVRRHPTTFSDPHLKVEYLGPAYLVSAWACFELRKKGKAAEYGRKFCELCGPRPVWPLQYADRLPFWLTRSLVWARRRLGHLLRKSTDLFKRFKPQASTSG